MTLEELQSEICQRIAGLEEQLKSEYPEAPPGAYLAGQIESLEWVLGELPQYGCNLSLHDYDYFD
jgi:hypothetical protein